MTSGRAFHVAMIVPPGYEQAVAFRELSLLLKSALLDLGHSCTTGVNSPDLGRTNVVLGYHLLDSVVDMKFVAVQLEQLCNGHFPYDTRPILRKAIRVWDYCQEQADMLNSEGIGTDVMKVGYHPKLQLISADRKTTDVLFYGLMGPRREAILGELLRTRLRCQIRTGIYGRYRDSVIAKSKVVVNIHYRSNSPFESVRVSYLLNNGVCVVSEEVPEKDYPWPGVPLPMASVRDLPALCEDLVRDDQKRWKVSEQCKEAFRALYPMTEILRPLVEKLPA